MSGAAKLRLDHFGKRFPVLGGAETVAVEDFTLEVRQGEFLVIVGPSGCGKTTVLNVLAGLDSPTSGTVAIDDRIITGPGPDRGVMFQDYALFPWQTVWGNVEFGLRYGPAGNGLDRDARAQRVRRTIDLVGLAGAEGKYPHQLSGGMRQRAALARRADTHHPAGRVVAHLGAGPAGRRAPHRGLHHARDRRSRVPRRSRRRDDRASGTPQDARRCPARTPAQ
ncbi:MAG: ATP-binding cassette domain-containing protein [Casimicrobiaceae bacterium]